MKYFYLILIFPILANQAIALDVVKPSNKNSTVFSNSFYIYGSVKPESALKINSQNVKILKRNVFIETIPLTPGDNTITLKEIHKDGSYETKSYNIKQAQYKASTPSKYVKAAEGKIIYAKTIKDYSPVREKPSDNSNRVAELPKGVILYISGKQGNFYKINEQGEFWINKNYIDAPQIIEKRTPFFIGMPKKYSDTLYNYIKFKISHPVLFTLKGSDKKLKLTFYTSNNQKPKNEYVIDNTNKIAGYDGFYKDGYFILQTQKIPKVKNLNKPLEGIRIFIDAGHGGSEPGAIGFSRIPEKYINLEIAKKLIYILQKEEGAIVSYSRIEDEKVGLYDRVEKAKKNKALISVSIHNNSLPEGNNPLTKHGTGVYYYNENSKQLALIIKKNMVKDLGLKDDGINHKSLVLTRSVSPISVLAEIGYMIHPEEYFLLLDENFQMKAADSIRKSLREYIISLQN